MEAAAVYQAGIRFFSPDRMLFLKVVSDSGVAGQERMTAETLAGLLEQHVKAVAGFLANLWKAADEEEALRSGGILQEDEAVLEQIWRRCTARDDAGVGAAVYHVRGAYRIRLESGTERMVCAGLLPCKDRREGKVRLEELKQVLL